MTSRNASSVVAGTAVLGILWLWGIGALLALILGIVARNQIHDSNGGQSGERLAVAGIVLGVVGLVGAAVLTLVVFAASPSSFYTPGG
jgi:Na+/proline symporter